MVVRVKRKRGGKTGDNEDFINQHWSSAVRSPRHCWSHYQFRCWDVLKNAWLCKLSHSLSRRDNRQSHTPRGGVLWGGRGGRRKKTKDGCLVTQRPPAKLAGGSRGPINSAEQNSKILDAGMEATTASPCCWWPTGDIYRYTYKKKNHPASVIKHWEDKNVSRNESKNANVMRMSTQFLWHWSQINSICFQEFSDRLCVVDLVSCLRA